MDYRQRNFFTDSGFDEQIDDRENIYRAVELRNIIHEKSKLEFGNPYISE